MTYEGARGHWVGWKFTLSPQNGKGVPGYGELAEGYIRTQLAPPKGLLDEIKRNAFGRSEEQCEQDLQRALNKEPEWIEAQWLVEWLKRGLIREVSS